jgi:peptide/nickel transport system substrate-binding protein
MYNNHVMALSKALATPEKIAGNWSLDGLRCVERWWFA